MGLGTKVILVARLGLDQIPGGTFLAPLRWNSTPLRNDSDGPGWGGLGWDIFPFSDIFPSTFTVNLQVKWIWAIWATVVDWKWIEEAKRTISSWRVLRPRIVHSYANRYVDI